MKPLINMGIVFGVLYLTKQVNMNDPDIILMARILYAVVHVLIIGAYGYMFWLATNSNNQTKIRVKKPQQFGQPADPETIEMTIAEYDKDNALSLLKKTLVGVGISCFISYKWGVVTPLVIQSVMNPIALYDAPLFKILVLGREAVGPLARPFKEETPFGNLMQQQAEAPAPKEKKNKKKD
eukprot:GEZU01029055.1.p2 GENE.GEZU01029055.1~~GEZU01029055.1.p2  ORF type:complete len:181 (-),score=62.09 GEZU01029055.1:34-576(-)